MHPYDDYPDDTPPANDTDDSLDYTDEAHEPVSDFGRDTANDPLFGLVITGAISLGLIPLIDNGAYDLRYTLVWGLIAAFGVVSWLLGSATRIEQETPENLVWGVTFGLLLGVPLLAFGGGTLVTAGSLMFPELTLGALLAYIVFVMPLAETLFFRGLLQKTRTFWETGLLATGWQLALFFPMVNRGPYPLIVGVILLMANITYSYVNERNGLAAAWLSQITIHMLLLFIPAITG